MVKPVRVLLLGTGQMGSGIGRLIHAKQGVELVGGYALRAKRAGMDLGRAIGLDEDLGLLVGGDLKKLVRQSRPDVAIQATCSTILQGRAELLTLVGAGVNVISIAEEMAYPAASSPSFAKEIHQLAVAKGVGVLGTGVNPGFVLDLLIITLSGACSHISQIRAERVNDLSPYGHSVLKAQGVGLTPEEFQLGLHHGTVMGHYGFKESIHMIADALGWNIQDIEEERQPIISKVERRTPFVTVEPGQVAGCLHQAVAYCANKPVIILRHPQQIHPGLEGIETGDSIEIKGTPMIRLAGSPEIAGGAATCALAVNMIPRLLAGPAGLHCMADLPVPAAVLGDIRQGIHEPVDL